MVYIKLLQDFKQSHCNQLNIVLHIFSTSIGLFGLLCLTNYSKIISLIYSLYMLSKISYETSFITMSYLGLINYLSNQYPIDYLSSIGYIFYGFILQELCHWFTNEKTFSSSYYDSLNISFLKKYILQSLYLIPLLIDTTICSKFNKVFINNNNISHTKLESELDDDIDKINDWVLKQNPSHDFTTHWWYVKLDDIKHSFQRISKSKNIFNSLHTIFDLNMYNIERIESMDEIYVSSFNEKFNSDKVFFSHHIDGPMGIFPGIKVYRSIVAVTENEYISTNFPMHNQDYCLSKGDFLGFDYNRDIHYIYKNNENKVPEYRVVLKIHYLIYPKMLKWYAKLYGLLTSLYNTIARKLFVYTLNPNGTIGNGVTKMILGVTDNWFLLEKYAGFNNLAYIVGISIISYFFKSPVLFIFATSFIHYSIYIGTYYYRDNVLYEHFKRDCLFYKNIALINLATVYYKSIIDNYNNPLLLVIFCGYMITAIASYKLGLNGTYFGSELGCCTSKRINSFPYNCIPHPMIVGQIISLTTLYTFATNDKYKLLIPIHISLYLIHMLQEEFNINSKSSLSPFIKNIVSKTYIYPIIWEDSTIDDIIMNINENDVIITITSGGDNVLDALIHSPKKIYSIDMNKHQNYLLELKIASIKVLDRVDFLNTFGTIDSSKFFEQKDEILNNLRTEEAREWWKNNLYNIKRFNRSGSSGTFVNILEYVSKHIFSYDPIGDIVKNSSMEYQSKLLSKFLYYKISSLIYFGYRFFGDFAGVPVRQIQLMELNTNVIDNIVSYLLRSTNVMKNNHYYRFYAKGLSEECCFDYMKEENYNLVRKNLDNIEIHTDDIVNFVNNCPESSEITKAILLDHQDWIEQVDLVKEWKCFYNRMRHCNYFWRSSAPIQSSGILDNLNYDVKCTIKLENPDKYSDRVGMYRSVFYAKFKDNTLIPNVRQDLPKLDFYSKINVFKNMMLYSFTNKDNNDSHEEFLNKFYENQANDYDAYRREMLHGKKQLMYSIPYRKGDNVLLLAGGTADVLDYISSIVNDLGKITIVDLSKPLLNIARKRIKDNGWEEKVEVIYGDATKFNNNVLYDVVIITYSLTMILDWKLTLDNINNFLSNDGYLAISDFGIAPDQTLISKLFWKNMFSVDGVYLNDEHCKYTDKNFEKVFREFKYGSFPLVPLIKCPYYFSLHKK